MKYTCYPCTSRSLFEKKKLNHFQFLRNNVAAAANSQIELHILLYNIMLCGKVTFSFFFITQRPVLLHRIYPRCLESGSLICLYGCLLIVVIFEIRPTTGLINSTPRFTRKRTWTKTRFLALE